MTPTEHINSLIEQYDCTPLWHSDRRSYGWSVVQEQTNPHVLASWWESEVLSKTGLHVKLYGMRRGTIVVPRPWLSKKAYLACLHEIGHIAMNHTLLIYGSDPLRCEGEAWVWALHNYAAYRMTDAVAKTAASWLRTYLTYNRPTPGSLPYLRRFRLV